MSPYFLLFLIPAGVALLYAISLTNNQVMQNYAGANDLFDQLDGDILSVSLLVSRQCPANSDSHSAVIEAAKCLVFPTAGPGTIVTAAALEARYQKGLDLLDEARKIVANDI